MANQEALNVFRRILAERKVCTCLCSQFCFSNLHVLITIVTMVQISVESVPSDLAKGLVRRGSLVQVHDELDTWLEFPSTLHAEYFRQAAVSCQRGFWLQSWYACGCGNITHHQMCCADTSITKPPLQGNSCLQWPSTSCWSSPLSACTHYSCNSHSTPTPNSTCMSGTTKWSFTGVVRASTQQRMQSLHHAGVQICSESHCRLLQGPSGSPSRPLAFARRGPHTRLQGHAGFCAHALTVWL